MSTKRNGGQDSGKVYWDLSWNVEQFLLFENMLLFNILISCLF